MTSGSEETINKFTNKEYQYGFTTDVETDTFPVGLNEDVIRAISAKKDEPESMLLWRLEAYKKWQKMTEPEWAFIDYPKIDYQNISYYSAPSKKSLNSLDELDPEILATYEKLGIPLGEQKRMNGIAVDAVFDSVSIATTFKEELDKAGVIFLLHISEAVKRIS